MESRRVVGQRIAVSGALALVWGMAGAEETPAYALGEIVVTGEKPRVVDQVTTVDEITADEIRRRGARNLEEAINLVPGVYVRNGAAMCCCSSMACP
jgi:outer membrane receptor for ferrienterochelin and colicin